MNSASFVVGIAGGSGSGKSTYVSGLKRVLGDLVTVISYDDYYKARDDLTYDERCLINYDEPDAFDTELFCRHITMLKNGMEIDAPVYDFTVHNRRSETRRIIPRRVILLDGILLFQNDDIVDCCDLKIFIDTDADTRIIRRIIRDMRDRGRSLDSVTKQYMATVKPMYEKHVEPSKKKADIIIPNGGKNPIAVEMAATYIKNKIGF